ncbi:MAG: hypothetical protein ROY99_13770 [Ignavibacterium sp.]|jgi:poly(3-hydroxyalkanoate) synthetase|nr:hypothetical protein [Ignavibacterium sp.]
MKRIQINLIKVLVIVFAFFLFSNNYLFGFQQDEKKTDEITNTLKQKVLLTSDQETKVKDIISELQNKIAANPASKSQFISQAQTKLESLLDKKQKLKYDIIKNEIWKKF